ncbi:MAG: Gfo/Idh/MocA family oxidoreductase [Gemmatimonadota bacterium]
MDGDRTVGYAVVGLGWISQAAMLPAFANARHARLAALVSGGTDKRRRLAERYHLDPERDTYAYDAFEACLARDDVDAVYIAVPNHLHGEYTERAAAAGVHVLCEKPMAVTGEECRAMIRACDEAGVELMVAYRLHFDPANLVAVERVRSGAIGRTRVFSATFTQQVEAGDIRLMPPERGGGPLYDIGIYCINAARYLFRAEPEAVWATRASRPQARFDQAGEMMSCVLRFPGDRLATFTCSFGAHAVSVFHLVGDAGALRMDNAFNFTGERRLEVVGDDGGTRTFSETDQFGPQLDYFAGCVREDRRPEPDGEEGLVDVRIIRALYEALEDGSAVEIDVRRDRRPEPGMAAEYPSLEAPELVGADEPSD